MPKKPKKNKTNPFLSWISTGEERAGFQPIVRGRHVSLLEWLEYLNSDKTLKGKPKPPRVKERALRQSSMKWIEGLLKH